MNSKTLYKIIQLEFRKAILEARQEISGKYDIDPRWVFLPPTAVSTDVDIPSRLPEDLQKSWYDLCRIHSEFPGKRENTRKGIEELIKEIDIEIEKEKRGA